MAKSRMNWSRHKEPEKKPAHRPIDEIKRDIANSPAQSLPALQAELAAALDAQRQEG